MPRNSYVVGKIISSPFYWCHSWHNRHSISLKNNWKWPITKIFQILGEIFCVGIKNAKVTCFTNLPLHQRGVKSTLMRDHSFPSLCKDVFHVKISIISYFHNLSIDAEISFRLLWCMKWIFPLFKTSCWSYCMPWYGEWFLKWKFNHPCSANMLCSHCLRKFGTKLMGTEENNFPMLLYHGTMLIGKRIITIDCTKKWCH